MAVITFIVFCMEITVSSVDPDQTPHLAASELGLLCLHSAPKGEACLKRVKCVAIRVDVLLFITYLLQNYLITEV